MSWYGQDAVRSGLINFQIHCRRLAFAMDLYSSQLEPLESPTMASAVTLLASLRSKTIVDCDTLDVAGKISNRE